MLMTRLRNKARSLAILTAVLGLSLVMSARPASAHGGGGGRGGFGGGRGGWGGYGGWSRWMGRRRGRLGWVRRRLGWVRRRLGWVRRAVGVGTPVGTADTVAIALPSGPWLGTVRACGERCRLPGRPGNVRSRPTFLQDARCALRLEGNCLVSWPAIRSNRMPWPSLATRLDGVDTVADRILGGSLTAALTTWNVLLSAVWLPQYLTWPWWTDLDHFGTFAMAWDCGVLPYRDLPTFQFPGEYYLFWVVGKVFGWGRTGAGSSAVDAALLAGFSGLCPGGLEPAALRPGFAWCRGLLALSRLLSRSRLRPGGLQQRLACHP